MSSKGFTYLDFYELREILELVERTLYAIFHPKTDENEGGKKADYYILRLTKLQHRFALSSKHINLSFYEVWEEVGRSSEQPFPGAGAADSTPGNRYSKERHFLELPDGCNLQLFAELVTLHLSIALLSRQGQISLKMTQIDKYPR